MFETTVVKSSLLAHPPSLNVNFLKMRWFVILSMSTALCAQNNFVGAMGGIATLSADGRTSGSPPTSTSSYKPENGASLFLFGGRHISDYFAAQLSYSRNQNDVVLTGTNLIGNTSFEQPLRATMQTVGFEAMGYFRARDSKLRPYLSAGPVATWLRTRSSGPVLQRGTPVLPPARIASASAGLRVAVGIDLRVNSHIELRYTFSETLQGNAISRALDPAGLRKLANFQNLWGVTFRF
jgi:hypothetical protein